RSTPIGTLRHRRAALAQPPCARGRSKYGRLRVEMDAVLDGDFPCRPDDDPARHLRRRDGRRGDRRAPFRPRHLSADGEPLSGLHAALDVVDLGRLHHRLSGFGRRARGAQSCARYARLPLRLRHRAALARRRRRDVGASDPHPDGVRSDAAVSSQRGAAVIAAAWPRDRLRRVATEVGSALVGLVLLIWSLLPLYNMLLIALDPEEGEVEFSGNIWTPEPSLQSFVEVVTQDARYLEHFWQQFGNSVIIGAT